MIWKHDILRENDADNLIWGMSASVLVVDGKVIALPGAGKRQFDRGLR